MTPSTEPATPAVSSPKPKPQVAGAPPATPAASSPKPKPNVAGAPSEMSPKPKPAGRPSGNPAGGARLAPFESYSRSDTSKSSASKEAQEEGGMRTKPVAKKRLIAVFPGDTQKN